MLPAYSTIFALGHKATEGILDGPVVVQEKIDGSQFSFGIINGELHMRSKGAEVYVGADDKLFLPAIDTVKRLFDNGKLVEGWVYRAEAVCKPKHNVLHYNRTATGFIVLYDVMVGLENYLLPDKVAVIAHSFGVDVAPTLYQGRVMVSALEDMLTAQSVLGGGPIEGVVIKRYDMFGQDKKVLMAKLVRSEFQEKHKVEWVKEKPSTRNIIETIAEALRTEARWQKAVQHLAESGQLVNAPQDIGPLIKEIQHDVLQEEEEYIKQQIFNYVRPHISRKLVAGFPEWYKKKLTLELEKSI